MSDMTIGALVHDFFVDYLRQQKGLRTSSIRSYRDTLRLFLPFVAKDVRRPISRLQLEDVTFERVLAFLHHIEIERQNSVSTRNQRLAALRTFFEYVGRHVPEALQVCQKVAAIPSKRTALPETRYIDRDEVEALFRRLPDFGRLAARDRALLLFLYNTGARVQEVADLRVEHLMLDRPPYVRLHGKGDKWRQCPLWQETADQMASLLKTRQPPSSVVFASACGQPLTRFGIYKRVRELTRAVAVTGTHGDPRHVTPHIWRHTAAVHLLEAGVDVNVIRGWLGHVSLATTHRYSEITMRMKIDTLRLSAPGKAVETWRGGEDLLTWLAKL